MYEKFAFTSFNGMKRTRKERAQKKRKYETHTYTFFIAENWANERTKKRALATRWKGLKTMPRHSIDSRSLFRLCVYLLNTEHTHTHTIRTNTYIHKVFIVFARFTQNMMPMNHHMMHIIESESLNARR